MNILASEDIAAALLSKNRRISRRRFDFGRTYSRSDIRAACVEVDLGQDTPPQLAFLNAGILPEPIIGIERQLEQQITEALDSAARLDSFKVKPGKIPPIIHVLNIGQGDSILVESINGENWLIDAYFSHQKYADFKRKISSLKRSKIDRLFISHFHFDHIKSAARVIADFSPSALIISDTLKHRTAPVANLLTAASNARILYKVNGPLRQSASSGMGVALVPVAHFSSSQSFDPNDHTMALCLETKKEIALLSGDAPGDLLSSAWAWYAPSAKKKRFYKVTHHCSATGNHQGFLTALNPEVSVTSCSRNNRYRHPSDPPRSYLDNNSRHLITHLHGADISHAMA